jgi:hypothetical protein
MAVQGEVLLRLRVCFGNECRAVFFLCSRCDRGQRYCSLACRERARIEQRRRANPRHQQSPEGRLDHRDRQRAYRERCRHRALQASYLSFDDKAADLLYEVINRRYERKPLIITTNRPFKEWNEVFPNATCIVTLLDRLLHHADVTVIEGDSYRVRESEQETAARRKKK